MIAKALRLARTGAYRLAGPFDRLWLRATGRAGLPPLWLRRHSGPIAAFESAARETIAFLDSLGLLGGAHCVLDVGCGPGAMAGAIADRLPEGGRYVGFDVHAPSIRWCRRRWSEDARLAFTLAPIASPYGSATGPPAASYRFPVDDGEADLVLAKSVFTHLLEAEARHYLSEIRRVLRPGRPAVLTAFLFEDGQSSVDRVFPHSPAPGLRLRRRTRSTAAVAWEKTRFVELVNAAGLRLQWHSAGYYPGREFLTAQDVLLLGH